MPAIVSDIVLAATAFEQQVVQLQQRGWTQRFLI
jgi:hypothetical protein